MTRKLAAPAWRPPGARRAACLQRGAAGSGREAARAVSQPARQRPPVFAPARATRVIQLSGKQSPFTYGPAPRHAPPRPITSPARSTARAATGPPHRSQSARKRFSASAPAESRVCNVNVAARGALPTLGFAGANTLWPRQCLGMAGRARCAMACDGADGTVGATLLAPRWRHATRRQRPPGPCPRPYPRPYPHPWRTTQAARGQRDVVHRRPAAVRPRFVMICFVFITDRSAAACREASQASSASARLAVRCGPASGTASMRLGDGVTCPLFRCSGRANWSTRCRSGTRCKSADRALVSSSSPRNQPRRTASCA